MSARGLKPQLSGIQACFISELLLPEATTDLYGTVHVATVETQLLRSFMEGWWVLV